MGNETNIIYAFLPTSYKHVIISSKYNDEDHFEAVVRLKANSKESFLLWLNEFEQITNTKWVVHKTYPNVQRLVLRVDYICQHGPPRPRGAYKGVKFTKKIECKAKLIFKLYLVTKSTLRKNSFLKDDLQGLVIIRNNHNHTTKTAASLSLLRPNENCKQQFESYFNNGLNVIDAMKYHVDKLGLLADFSEAMLANGSINPKYRTVRWWYQRWRLTNIGPPTGTELLELLEKKIQIYKDSGVNIILHRDPLIIIIITPIMRRANLMKEAAEIIFIDSTPGSNSNHHSITFIMMPIPAGAVPLCMIITSGKTSTEYELAFNLYNAATEGQNFGGRGDPEIILSDDSDGKYKAISNVYPNSMLKPYIFQVQQTIWSWLWDNRHGIAMNERQTLMQDFQTLVKCSDEMTAFQTYNIYKDSFLWSKYPKWIIYINSYWAKRRLWCKAWRDDRLKDIDVNNFCDASIRLFKDIFLTRNKAYNTISIIDFISTVLEDYYRYHLRNFSLSRKPQLLLENLFIKSLYLKRLDIVEIDEYMYIIQPVEKNDDNYYLVNLGIGTCTCDAALGGRFCKHQAAVWKYFGKISTCVPAISNNDLYKMSQLALGVKSEDPDLYLNSIQGSKNTNIEDLKLCENLIGTSENMNEENRNINTNISINSLDINKKMEHEMFENDIENISFNCIIEKLQQLENKYSSSNLSLNNILNHLHKINTKKQWEAFLYKLGVEERDSYKHSLQINTKASKTSTLNYRQNIITRVSKKLPNGKVPIMNSRKIGYTRLKRNFKTEKECC